MLILKTIILSFFIQAPPIHSAQQPTLTCNPEWKWCDLLAHINEEYIENNLRGITPLSMNGSTAIINIDSIYSCNHSNYYIWYDADHISLWKKKETGNYIYLEHLLQFPYTLPTYFSLLHLYTISKNDNAYFYIYANPNIPLKHYFTIFSTHTKYIGKRAYPYGPLDISAYKSPVETMLNNFIPEAPNLQYEP